MYLVFNMMVSSYLSIILKSLFYFYSGRMFNGINWGSAGNLEYINGSVRVYTWMFQNLDYVPNLQSNSYAGTTDPVTRTLSYNAQNNSIIMMVQVREYCLRPI